MKRHKHKQTLPWRVRLLEKLLPAGFSIAPNTKRGPRKIVNPSGVTMHEGIGIRIEGGTVVEPLDAYDAQVESGVTAAERHNLASVQCGYHEDKRCDNDEECNAGTGCMGCGLKP